MKAKHWLRLLKLALFLGLMAFVVSRIEWWDAARPAGGAWLSGVFQEDGAGKARFAPEPGAPVALERAPGADGAWREAGGGTAWEIRAGFLPRLRRMHLGLFGLAALTYFLCASFAALRWHWLLKANDLQVSLWHAWRLNWVGVFFNNVVPGLTGGDVVKAYYIARHTGKNTVPILTVVVDRILGLAALALLSLLVVLGNFAKFRELAFGILAVLAAVAVVTVLFFSRRVRRGLRLSGLLRKLPGSNLFQRIDDALTFYRNKKRLLVFWLVASMFNHVLSTGYVVLLGEAMDFSVSLIDYFVLVPVINIISSAPVAPAGWGVGEALYELLFARFAGLGPGEGASLSAVSRTLVTAWSLLGGLLLLGLKGRVSAAEIERAMQAQTGAQAGTEDQ